MVENKITIDLLKEKDFHKLKELNKDAFGSETDLDKMHEVFCQLKKMGINSFYTPTKMGR